MHKPKKILFFINFVLLFIIALSLGINQFIVIKTNEALGVESIFAKIIKIGKAKQAATNGMELGGDITEDAIKLVIAEGVPDIYGEELAVSFSEVQPAINVMKQYDPTYGKQKITLAGDDLKRYIDVGLRISCEYCCGVKSIIRADGDASCGCAHSIAMRGLAAYLIKNHGPQYSNDEILRELARWKGVYFPKQMIKKMAQQLQSGNYTPDTASLVLGLELPDYGGEGKGAPLPSEIDNLPGMVGGC